MMGEALKPDWFLNPGRFRPRKMMIMSLRAGEKSTRLVRSSLVPGVRFLHRLRRLAMTIHQKSQPAGQPAPCMDEKKVVHLEITVYPENPTGDLYPLHPVNLRTFFS